MDKGLMRELLKLVQSKLASQELAFSNCADAPSADGRQRMRTLQRMKLQMRRLQSLRNSLETLIAHHDLLQTFLASSERK